MAVTSPAPSPSSPSSWLRAYSPLQIAVAGLLAVAVLLGAVLVVRAITTPPLAVLYTGLSTTDAATITEELTAQGVAYEISAGGTTISVPADRVDALRLSLASAGLPESSVVGYEILDGQSLTTSSFREQVNYQRALEGELARTLMSMDEVEGASVRLVLPEERAFSTETRPASAAVQLVTTGPLSDDQVQAIVHLVASSVPDLAPERVTVTDSEGTLLAGGPSGAMAGEKAAFEIESKLSTAADSMLASVLGPGKAVVRVAADLTRDEVMQQSEVFDPDRVVVGSESTTTEQYSSTKNETGGVIVPNPPNNNAPTSDEQSTFTSDSQTVDNKVSRTVTETSTPAGDIERLTVAVAVDEAVTIAEEDVIELVANAVGLDEARGDTIAVTKIPFAQPEEVPVETPEAPLLGGLLPTIIGAVLLVLVSVGLLLRLRSRKTPLDPQELAAMSAPPAQAQESRPSRSQAERLLDRVDSSPQEAANVLRGWLAEDAAKGT